MFISLVAVAALFRAVGQDCSCPASVTVRAERRSANAVTYVYKVKNQSTVAINAVILGHGDGAASLPVLPLGCEPREEWCACSVAAPKRWSGCVQLQEESDLHSILFDTGDERAQIRPGFFKELRVTLPREDASYEHIAFETIGDAGCTFSGVAQPEVPSIAQRRK